MSGFLDRFFGVPGGDQPRVRGLSSFDPGPLVKIQGIPRPTGRAPVNPDICYQIQIPIGSRGTTATLERMAEMAVEASQDPGFVQMTRGVVRECASKDVLCEGSTIQRHVEDVITYRNDPAFAELVSSPGWTYYVDGQEDCDGQATLIAAMDCSVGRGCRFGAYMLDREMARRGEYSHVLAELGVRDASGVKWLGQDSVARQGFGWLPPKSEWLGPPNYLVVLSP